MDDINIKIEKIEEYIQKRALLGKEEEVFAINLDEKSENYGWVALIGINTNKILDKYKVPDFVDILCKDESEYLGSEYNIINNENKQSIKEYDRLNKDSYLVELIGTDNIPIYSLLNKIENLVLGKNVKIIGDYCFKYDMILKNVDVQCKSLSIEYSAFSGCSNLKKFDFKSVEKLNIHYTAFNGSGLCAADLTNVYYLGESSFSNCKDLKSVKIGGFITEVPANCFINNTKLNRIELNKNIHKINSSAFENTGLTEVDLSSINELGSSAFSECKCLRNIKISNSIKCIPNHCFFLCEIDTINIPESVNKIERCAFCVYDHSSIVREINIAGKLDTIYKSSFNTRGIDKVTYQDKILNNFEEYFNL